ncbi:hypothetical protein [Coraliomargarita parva]|uniref:hypothetical protein n=1 Tax=Coraliomargarita parva TaxID=3014050 RepID=UPI0022B58C65|nr:hypothetical protein [Coraliomargarita parva]
MKRLPPILFLSCVLFSAVHGRTLLLDTFNDSQSTGSEDVNQDLYGGRQAGTRTPLQYFQGSNGSGSLLNETDKAYRTQVDNCGNADALWLVGEQGEFAAVSPDDNLKMGIGANEIMVIRLTIDPADSGGWGGITFGASDNAAFGMRGTGARGQFFLGDYNYFGFLVDTAGSFKAFKSGVQIGTAQLVAGQAHQFVAVVSGDGKTAPFDGVGTALVEVYADGNPEALIVHQVANDFSDNYLTLLGFGTGFDIQAFEDLEVSIVDIPEPASCVSLAGWLVWAFVMIKRRRVV